MLSIYIDFKSPASYLALKPTLSLIHRRALNVAWLPFRTLEREIPADGTGRGVAEQHHRVREASRRATFVKYAQLQGLDLRFPENPGSSDLALGVLAALSPESALPFVERCFAAYWERHEDLDDEAVVGRLLPGDGPADGLSSSREALKEAQVQAEAAGVVDAPAYALHGHIFIGRAHLPWVEELATTVT